MSSGAGWLREPLLHFLVVGLALFAVSRLVGNAPGREDRLTRIEITPDDIRQIEMVWMAQWRRPPTPEELRGLVDARVREEILYREALALGLDRGDTIVKRRMAQKMEFLAEDVSALPEPTTEEVRAWFEANGERFALPGRVSFRHLYFSSDRRETPPRVAALEALERLAGTGPDSPGLAGSGDPFMFQDYYGDREPDQVASIFGTAFADFLFQLEASGSWQGPVESGFGWHLIRVESKTPRGLPAFEEVESLVKNEWIADQRAGSKQKAFEAMKDRYTVIFPKAPADVAEAVR